jgi:hypothetical protein
MDIKYINIFHSKSLQNLPKLVFLVWKYTIWQPFLETKKSRNWNLSALKSKVLQKTDF